MIRPLALLLLALSAPSFAAAPQGSGKWEAGFHPGFAVPVGAGGDSWETSFSLKGSIETQCPVKKNALLGFELGYNTGHDNKTFGGLSAKFLQMTPTYRINAQKLSGSKLRPYGIAGLGFYHHSTSDVDTMVGAVRVTAKGSSDFHIGFNLGGGVMVPIDERFDAGFDMRYHHVFMRGPNFQWVAPMARLQYKF